MGSVYKLRCTGGFCRKVEVYWLGLVYKLSFPGGFSRKCHGLIHGGFSRKVVIVYMISSVEKLWSTWSVQ